MIKRFLLFLVLATVAANCGVVRGERVETGFLSAETKATRLTTFVDEASTLVSASPASASPAPVQLGSSDASESFNFRARELYSGTILDGMDLFGQGEVLVTFVQPGCEISIDGGPTMAEVAELHPEAIYVIVHSGADDEAYINFAEAAELYQENMVHLSDHFGSLAARYGVDEYPTTLLIDADYRITSVVGVMNTEAQLEAVAAVGKSAP